MWYFTQKNYRTLIYISTKKFHIKEKNIMKNKIIIKKNKKFDQHVFNFSKINAL